MTTILEKILERQRVLVKENERAIALYKGEVLGILSAGEHWLPNRRNRLDLYRHDLGTAIFVSPFEKALFDKLPDIAARHLTVVRVRASRRSPSSSVTVSSTTWLRRTASWWSGPMPVRGA